MPRHRESSLTDTTDGESGSEYSDETSKRKRNSMDRDIFKKSKLLIRSPAKSATTSASKEQQGSNMDEIKDMFEALMNEMKEVRKEHQEYREEMKEMKLENERMNTEIEGLKKRVEQLENVEKVVERLEKDRIKNNLVIKGLKVNEDNKEQISLHFANFFRNCLSIETVINAVQKVNESMFVVELDSFETKMKILKKKGKAEELKRNNIYVNSDLTKEERKIQKVVRDAAKQEKEKGNRVTTGYQKLIVNGRIWKWNKVAKKLQEEVEVAKN